MKKYFSYSEFLLYIRDEKKYYRQYIEGEQFEPNKEMKLGSIIHKSLEDKKFEWIPALRKEELHKEKIVRTLLDKMEAKRPVESEVPMVAKTKSGVLLFSIFDGLDKKNRELDEFKTSANEIWFQNNVDNHLQLSFYAWVWHLNYHSFFREIRLHFLNTAKGTVKTFYTARSKTDINLIEGQVERVIKDLKDRGWWNKRLGKNDNLAQGVLIPK